MSLTVVYCGKVPSTQDIAWERYVHHSIEKVAFWTDEQWAGRGRLGRKWLTPPKKAIAFSVSFSVNLNPAENETLSSNLGRHLIGFLTHCFPTLKQSLKLKPPNDIYIEDKKVCGILIESKFRQNTIYALTVGVGINVFPYDFPEEIRATYLASVVNDLPPLPVLADMLTHASFQFFKPYLI
ncbi:MAG: biotin--[acetyl-CoA-carboxylase] ligase [Chlorobi bacterium]|nr:biotin--[acetyl-CoA-carboxylase] ligase [Chlorobiota bacterium]